MTGDSGTLHVFELSQENKFSPSSFLPSLFSNPTRSSFKITLPLPRRNSIASLLVDTLKGARLAPLDTIDAERRVFVACSDGVLYEYDVSCSAEAADPAGAGGGDSTETKRKPPVVHRVYKK